MACRPPFSLHANEICLACEEDITAGDLKTNDSYDLYLLSRGKPVREYVLVCFMNLQFFFSDKGGKWSYFEKQTFVSKWARNILSVWNRKVIRVLPNGTSVILEFKFKFQIEGIWLYDHWEISVVKTNQFLRSYVNGFWGNSQLDSLDLETTYKGIHNQKNFYQRGTVHEFGHMLGLNDEYDGGSWVSDYESVMNSGEVIKNRHLKDMTNWVDRILKKQDIK